MTVNGHTIKIRGRLGNNGVPVVLDCDDAAGVLEAEADAEADAVAFVEDEVPVERPMANADGTGSRG